jgi:hypothetical protein
VKFCDQYYWYTSIEFNAIWKLNFLVETSLKIYLNFFFPAIKVKYFMYLKKKPIPNERERDFIVGLCIIFSDFFCLIMFYEPQT